MITWTSQDKLDYHIDRLLSRISDAKAGARKRRKRNVPDPFASLVVATTIASTDSERLQEFLYDHSVVRSVSNAIGEFHQNVLSSVEGWENHDSGYDLENKKDRVLAEVKNKHNTMNAPNRRGVESDLKTALRQKRGDWTGYLALVIPKRPIRYKKQLDNRLQLFEIDGASFYALVTGKENAIHELLDYMFKTTSPSNDITNYCLNVLRESLPPRI